MGQLGQPIWFHAGDRDLAVHLVRSQLLAQGRTLSEVTTEIAGKLGVTARILPMSDSRVETRVMTPIGDLSFEEYFVKRWYQDPVDSVYFAGVKEAEPAPGVLDAIHRADLILLAPSNPVSSIGPILAVPGVREALHNTPAVIAAVSPVIGGAAVSGPAGVLMAAQGFPVSIAGIAQMYSDFLDLLVADNRDETAGAELQKAGFRVDCTNTMMQTSSDKAALARAVLNFASGKSKTASERQ
jgi:LPPG:FO 2-phospho-L-lactate transferase